MTRFRDLLRFDPALSPAAEQRRATNEFPDTVGRSNMHYWKGRESLGRQGSHLVLAVAPYSPSDLAFLDRIDELLASPQSHAIPIYVANLLDYEDVERLRTDFPGIGSANPTPLVALWESGSLRRVESGKRAKDLVTDLLMDAAGPAREPSLSIIPTHS